MCIVIWGGGGVVYGGEGGWVRVMWEGAYGGDGGGDEDVAGGMISLLDDQQIK